MRFLKGIIIAFFAVVMLPGSLLAYKPELSSGVYVGSLQKTTEKIGEAIDEIFRNTSNLDKNFIKSDNQYEIINQQSKNGLSAAVKESKKLSTNISYAVKAFFGRIKSGMGLVFSGFRSMVLSLYSKSSGDDSVYSPTGLNEGVIVFPSRGALLDSQTLTRLKDTFSDEIVIVPDESGETGIIRPVFRKRNDPGGESYLGDEYIYLLVPVSPGR